MQPHEYPEEVSVQTPWFWHGLDEQAADAQTLRSDAQQEPGCGGGCGGGVVGVWWGWGVGVVVVCGGD